MTATGGGSTSRSVRSRAPDLPAVPGVVETIAGGLSLALVYPALAAVPLAIDAIAWTGVEVSPAALAATSTAAADAFDGLGLENNLARLVGLFVPTLLTWVDRDRFYTLDSATTIAPGTWWLGVATILALLGFGAFVLAAFRVPAAFVLRHQPLRLRTVIGSIVVAWLRFVMLALLVIGIAALLLFPIAVAGGLLLVMGIDATPLIASVTGLAIIIALVFLYFAPAAIAVSDVGPLRACYLSFNVVRRNLWPVVGLILSLLLISAGLPSLWLSQADHPIGLLIGAFCNALVSTGLVMASMQFYLDRLDRWQRTKS